MPKTPRLYLSGDPAADTLLAKDPFALLVGLVLDQQIPLERAFHAPLELNERLGEPATAALVESLSEEALVAAFCAPPALHRFPASMARRVQALARVVVDQYSGDPTRIWSTAATGEELFKRVNALPGFGAQKAKIFLALLAKQFGVRPKGWEEASSPFGAAGTRLSIADISSAESLAQVRSYKAQMKLAAKQQSDAR